MLFYLPATHVIYLLIPNKWRRCISLPSLSHGSLAQTLTRKVQHQTLTKPVLCSCQFLAVWVYVNYTYPTAWVKESSQSSITIQKRRESFVWASFEWPPSSNIPNWGSPEAATHAYSLQHTLNQVHSFTHAHIQTHILNTITHALITHAFPLPTVTGKQCPPIPSQCTPPLTSLLLPPALLLSLSSLLWELW